MPDITDQCVQLWWFCAAMNHLLPQPVLLCCRGGMERAAHKVRTRSSALFTSRRLGAAIQMDAQHEIGPAQAGGEQSSSLRSPGASGLPDAEANGDPKPVLNRGALTLPKEISVARSTKWMGRCSSGALGAPT